MWVKSSGYISLWNSPVVNCSTSVLLGGLDPKGVKLWLIAAVVVMNLVVTELQYLRSHPFFLNENVAASVNPRLVSRTCSSSGYSGFKKKLQVVQCFCLCPFEVYGLGCSAPALPRDIHLMSPASHRVSSLPEIVGFLNRAQTLMWKRQPTLANTLTPF